MKKIIDKFSKQSETYKKFRPTYPTTFYEEILKLCPTKESCWDCGTGNGQVAQVLSQHFTKVYASDISENQIANASPADNINYSIQRAEQTNFEANQFDLITVAQAVHWFDIEAFNVEAKRVCKNGGWVCLWGYSLLRIDESIDPIIDEFDTDIIGPYWNKERKLVDEGLKNIPFHFREIKLEKAYSINVNWTLEMLEGYFNSWSCVQNYKDQKDKNPVPWIIDQLREQWPKGMEKKIRLPIFYRFGQNV